MTEHQVDPTAAQVTVFEWIGGPLDGATIELAGVWHKVMVRVGEIERRVPLHRRADGKLVAFWTERVGP